MAREHLVGQSIGGQSTRYRDRRAALHVAPRKMIGHSRDPTKMSKVRFGARRQIETLRGRLYVHGVVPPTGIEPVTRGLESRRSVL